ncbi:GyrI-like domain-containing protein [bacterium]|nr:GyrI-like domain-containing protein [bacterium]
MNKMNLIILAFLAAAIGLVLFLSNPQSLKKHDYLENPRITTLPRQKMILVEAQGDPAIISEKSIALLFKTFFSFKQAVKGLKYTPPRARWPKPFDTPREEWIGIFGLAVPETVESLPASVQKNHPAVKLGYWEYGEVAEILHRGAYSEVGATRARLHEFIQHHGYQPIGVYEEEYIKGPGMFFKGYTKKHRTILRQQVEKTKPKN